MRRAGAQGGVGDPRATHPTHVSSLRSRYFSRTMRPVCCTPPALRRAKYTPLGTVAS